MPFWCDGSVRLLCGQNVNDSMWAIVGNEKLRMALATAWIGVTFSSLKSCTVSKTAKPGGSSTSLWSQNPHSFGWENTLVSISGGSGIRPSCSSCLIKPKSNGYKRDVVNTSIELQLFEVINSYYFLCNLFSSYGGLWNWTSFVCICRIGGSCNQKVRYGKIQKRQDSCKFEWQVLLLAVLFTTVGISTMFRETLCKEALEWEHVCRVN